MQPTYFSHRASGNRAVYNGIGSTTRNGPKAGRYGFLADMRLRLNQKFRAYFKRELFAVDGQRTDQLTCERHSLLVVAYAKAWRSRNRRYDVTYYGKHYVLNVCDPYCVILDGNTMQVAGIMPLATDQRLRGLYS